MYFPNEHLFFQDPIYNAVRDERARRAMISAFDLSETVPEWALAYEFDIVLTGRDATPIDEEN
jgi:protocatechuate 3,4-dioxygenase beta subunit